MCLLTKFSKAITIPDKSAEMAVQAYLQHALATFGGSITLIADNGKELKISWSKT